MTRPGQGWVASGRTTITDLHLVLVRWGGPVSRPQPRVTCPDCRVRVAPGCSAAVLQCRSSLATATSLKLSLELRPGPGLVRAAGRRHIFVSACRLQAAGWRLQRLWSAAALWCLTAAGFTPHHTAPTAFSRYCWVNWCETYLYTHHRNFIFSCIYIFCIYLDYKINVVFYFRILWGEMEGEGDLTFIC